MSEPAEQAFRRHYRDVYGFVRRRSATPTEAEDITADVFAAAVAGLDRFEPGTTPVLAWLYTVARRRLVDEARRRERAPLAPVEPPPADYGSDVAAGLRRAIDSLPDGQRTVVLLKLVHGWHFSEIADRQGLSEAACKMRFARALDRLREELEQEGVHR
jgi:RNA polymerase sigma-70 factor (ECF subfamily)